MELIIRKETEEAEITRSRELPLSWNLWQRDCQRMLLKLNSFRSPYVKRSPLRGKLSESDRKVTLGEIECPTLGTKLDLRKNGLHSGV